MVIGRIEAIPEGSGSGEVNQVIGEVVQQGTTHHNLLPCQKCVGPFDRGLPYYVKILQLKRADALL